MSRLFILMVKKFGYAKARRMAPQYGITPRIMKLAEDKVAKSLYQPYRMSQGVPIYRPGIQPGQDHLSPFLLSKSGARYPGLAKMSERGTERMAQAPQIGFDAGTTTSDDFMRKLWKRIEEYERNQKRRGY